MTVERMLRETDLSMRLIAAHTGIAYAAVRLWNRETGIRPRMRAGKRVSPERIPAFRKATAMEQGSRRKKPGLADRHGPGEKLRPATRSPRRVAGDPGAAPDCATLDRMLRAHIGRQILAFDDGLRSADATIDTAKVLRDLGGLKRLLDDLWARAPQPEAHGDADGESPQALAALRADLARRYDAFETGRQNAGIPGEPAGRSAPGLEP